MTRPYRDRRFVTYWGGQAVSELGDRVTELALPLIAITTLGASAAEVGVLQAAVWAPQIVSLVVGAWVDQRRSKRRVLIAGDVLQGVAIATLPIAWWLGVLSLGQVLTVALVTGVGRTLFQSAYPSFFASLVDREHYVEANSLLSTTRSGSFIAGPALGGLLVQVLGAAVAMVVDAVSFFFSALMLSRVRMVEHEPVDDGEGLAHRAVAGFRYLWNNPFLSASLRCCTTLNFFSFIASAVVILYASRSLGLGAGVIGLAFGVGSIGGLSGAVLAGRIARVFGMGRVIAAGAVLFTAPYALMPLASGTDLAKAGVLACVEAIGGFGIMLFDINLNALQTTVTRDDLRSRVSGAFATVNYGIRPLGAIVGGVLGSLIGVGPTLVVAAAGGAMSTLWLLASPIIRTRTLEEFSVGDTGFEPVTSSV